jgi:uncharacterized protein (DUF2345 family)
MSWHQHGIRHTPTGGEVDVEVSTICAGSGDHAIDAGNDPTTGGASVSFTLPAVTSSAMKPNERLRQRDLPRQRPSRAFSR